MVSPSLEPVSDDAAPDAGDVRFTAAVVGLGAKLAKADGRVTDDEVMAFSRIFRAEPHELPSIQRLFNIARQTVDGYENYAAQIARRYQNRPSVLEGVLDGLFQIALADGVITADEMAYLERVAEIFNMNDTEFRRIRASHLGPDKEDPYHILGVTPDMDFAEIRQAYRRLMAEHHPDKLAATRDAPARIFDHTAHEKAASISAAFTLIKAQHQKANSEG